MRTVISQGEKRTHPRIPIKDTVEEALEEEGAAEVVEEVAAEGKTGVMTLTEGTLHTIHDKEADPLVTTQENLLKEDWILS